MRGIGEDECLAKLGALLGCIFEPQSQFCPLDGVAPEAVIEIKQRNVKKDTYPSTLMGKNKIDHWEKHYPERPLYFFFRFIDGDYYYRWNPDDNIQVDIGGLRDEQKPYYFIPKELLTPF